MEVWKKIEGFENYEVSNFGNVKSLNYRNTKKEKLLKQSKNEDGYLEVCLCKNGITKKIRVHRLVSLSFLENKKNKETVNHKNGIKTDNTVDNLEWSTRKEQSLHSYKNKLQIKTNNKKVLNVDTMEIYDSVVIASEKNLINKSTLSLKLNGTRKNNTNLIYC